MRRTELSKKEDCLHNLLHNQSFPLSSKYEPEWVFENEMGPRALWFTEALCQVMNLAPGELRQFRGDGGRYLGFARMVARRRPG
jgi:hypothetical protein